MSNDIHIYLHLLPSYRTQEDALAEWKRKSMQDKKTGNEPRMEKIAELVNIAHEARQRFKTKADKNGSKKRPGRPRLTEEEKARRAMQRALEKQNEPEANAYKRGMRKPWPALTE